MRLPHTEKPKGVLKVPTLSGRVAALETLADVMARILHALELEETDRARLLSGLARVTRGQTDTGWYYSPRSSSEDSE